MKKYMKPTMEGQLFISNEYVGACTIIEDGSQYYFICDAGDGVKGGLYSEDWELISNSKNSYHACGDIHVSPTDGIYIKGYFDPDTNHDNGNETPIYIWEEIGTTCGVFNCWEEVVNRHATENLNKETWNKNFS